MIHYHGTPITPAATLTELAGRSFCVPFSDGRQVEPAHRLGEGVMLDNGAFSAWRRGLVIDWREYYEWCERWLEYPTTWAVIPDVIDGDEEANDRLLGEWPFGSKGAPVWHMHESLERLGALAGDWQRVCIGSSGDYAVVGDARWHRRMEDAMDMLCGNGPVPVWLHMLRGLSLAGSGYPFASADSTNVARNHNGATGRPALGAARMAARIDGLQCPARWRCAQVQEAFAV